MEEKIHKPTIFSSILSSKVLCVLRWGGESVWQHIREGKFHASPCTLQNVLIHHIPLQQHNLKVTQHNQNRKVKPFSAMDFQYFYLEPIFTTFNTLKWKLHKGHAKHIDFWLLFVSTGRYGLYSTKSHSLWFFCYLTLDDLAIGHEMACWPKETN